MPIIRLLILSYQTIIIIYKNKSNKAKINKKYFLIKIKTINCRQYYHVYNGCLSRNGRRFKNYTTDY